MLNKDKDNIVFKGNDVEHWKEIKGYPGYYISDYGRIKSFKKGKAKILKPRKRKNGYLDVNLCNDGQKKKFLIHRLIAEAFLLNPENKPEINHKNGVKTDNHVKNLEWVSKSENELHAYRIGLKKGLKGEKHPRSKLTDNEVEEILQMLDAGVPQREIAAKFNVDHTTISKIKTGKRWTHLTGITPKNSNTKNPAISQPISVNINIYLTQEAI